MADTDGTETNPRRVPWVCPAGEGATERLVCCGGEGEGLTGGNRPEVAAVTVVVLEADRRWAPGVCRREVGAPDRLAGADVDRLPGRKLSSLTTELIMSSTLLVFVVDAKWSAKLIWTVSPSLSGADLAGVMSERGLVAVKLIG